MSSDIRIVLVCPSPVISAGLSQIIGSGKGLCIVDSISDLADFSYRRMSLLRADAVILDPSAAGASGMNDLRGNYDALKDTILIGVLNAAYSKLVLDQFDSYFTVNDSQSRIVAAIRDAVESNSGEDMVEEGEHSILSSREREVLAEVARGLTNKEIADKLNISIFTVTTHRKNISQKLGIRSIAGLTVYAVMNGVIKQSQLE